MSGENPANEESSDEGGLAGRGGADDDDGRHAERLEVRGLGAARGCLRLARGGVGSGSGGSSTLRGLLLRARVEHGGAHGRVHGGRDADARRRAALDVARRADALGERRALRRRHLRAALAVLQERLVVVVVVRRASTAGSGCARCGAVLEVELRAADDGGHAERRGDGRPALLRLCVRLRVVHRKAQQRAVDRLVAARGTQRCRRVRRKGRLARRVHDLKLLCAAGLRGRAGGRVRVMGVLDVVGDGERRMSQTSEGLCVGESDGMHAFVRHTRTSVVGSYSAVSTACPSSAATRALLPTVELPSTTTRDTRGMAEEGGKKCREGGKK